jgi:hypothetical protein
LLSKPEYEALKPVFSRMLYYITIVTRVLCAKIEMTRFKYLMRIYKCPEFKTPI